MIIWYQQTLYIIDFEKGLQTHFINFMIISKIVDMGGQDEFNSLMIMLYFNYYINTLASNVKNNPTHENYARFLWK